VADTICSEFGVFPRVPVPRYSYPSDWVPQAGNQEDEIAEPGLPSINAARSMEPPLLCFKAYRCGEAGPIDNGCRMISPAGL